jgi:hypothetical protein
MLKDGLSLDDSKVARRRESESRAEYLRALLNAEQVIVNRAYLFNNPVVRRDFAKRGPERDAFKQLLKSQAIVPFLLTEKTPGELPAFNVDHQGVPAWFAVLREVRPQVLRLSWDDTANASYVNTYLFRRFDRFLQTLGSLTPAGLSMDLGISEAQARALRLRLREVNEWAWDNENVTRNQFYQRYVVRDGSNVAAGQYDPAKPFSGELKQLADLRYMTNLPDALDRFPLTPANSLHRTALQEERLVQPNRPSADPAALVDTLLRRRAFDLVQQPLAVSLTGLSLEHILQARHTDEWHEYILSLNRLVNDPEQFDKHAARVYWSYVNLATTLADIVGARPPSSGWLPVMKVLIEFVGATLTIVFGSEAVVQIVGQVATDVAGTASTAVVRFVVASHNRRQSQHELGTGIEIMKVKFAHTGDAWAQLISRFRAAGLKVRTVDVDEGAEDDPGMDAASPDEE